MQKMAFLIQYAEAVCRKFPFFTHSIENVPIVYKPCKNDISKNFCLTLPLEMWVYTIRLTLLLWEKEFVKSKTSVCITKVMRHYW